MPTSSALLAFVAASIVIVAIPGPSVLFTIGRALSGGRRAALLTVLGNALGVLAQVLALAVGLGSIIAASATLYTAVKAVGAAYLIWLGIQAIRHRGDLAASFEGAMVAPTPTVHVLRQGFLVGVTNPKTIVFFSALLPQFIDRGEPVWSQFVILGLVFTAVAIVGDSLVALAAGAVRDQVARRPERVGWLGGVGGALMTALGVFTLVSSRPTS